MRIASSNSISLFTALSSFHGFHVALIAYLNEVDLSMPLYICTGISSRPLFFPFSQHCASPNSSAFPSS